MPIADRHPDHHITTTQRSFSMKTKTQQGLLVAASAAALFLSGSVIAADKMSDAKQEASVHCAGINSCKGTSECKTATNSCKGQNACKGSGWVTAASAKECTDKGGTVAN
jgi:hypothetical protein